MSTLELQIFICGPIRTNLYLLINKATREAVLIDSAPYSFDEINVFLQQNSLKLVAVLLTHGHWDHMSDAKCFQDQGALVYASPHELELLAHPNRYTRFSTVRFKMHPCKPDVIVKDMDELHLLGTRWIVREVRGHSPGGLMFYLPEQGWAFSGDSIFPGSIGRTDFAGCNYEQLIREVRERILTLPPETILFTGHGPSTTVGEERTHNPFFKPIF